jgi:hypothetical protein
MRQSFLLSRKTWLTAAGSLALIAALIAVVHNATKAAPATTKEATPTAETVENAVLTFAPEVPPPITRRHPARVVDVLDSDACDSGRLATCLPAISATL